MHSNYSSSWLIWQIDDCWVTKQIYSKKHLLFQHWKEGKKWSSDLSHNKVHIVTTDRTVQMVPQGWSWGGETEYERVWNRGRCMCACFLACLISRVCIYICMYVAEQVCMCMAFCNVRYVSYECFCISVCISPSPYLFVGASVVNPCLSPQFPIPQSCLSFFLFYI